MSDIFQPAVEAVRVFPDGRITARDAARYLGIAYRSLAILRTRGGGPEFIKLGKSVFYRRPDLDRWIAENAARSTAQHSAQRRQRAAQPGAAP